MVAGTDVGVLANSWFDIAKGRVDKCMIAKIKIWMYFNEFTNCTKTMCDFCNTGTPVSVALGDHQCSVMSTLLDASTDIVMNISTSAQMSFVVREGTAR